MLYRYPAGLVAQVVAPYRSPHADPIHVRAGEPVVIDRARSATTDVVGWLWCTAADGRSGWTPAAWIDVTAEPPRMRRDFDAVELTVAVGDRVVLLYAESGFVRCRQGDREGWLPDGVLALVSPLRGA